MSNPSIILGTQENRNAGQAGRAALPACFHCGTPCRVEEVRARERSFCCAGCRLVFELLSENGLSGFYDLAASPGSRMAAAPSRMDYGFLDDPAVRQRIVDYSDEHLTRVTFHLPAIHCVACVWLLENLFRLEPGIGQSRVNFARREAAISFENARVSLSRVAALLASLGYPPQLSLSDVDGAKPVEKQPRRLWLQLGIAGFAFGNTMLFSLSSYFGFDSASGPAFERLFGWLSLVLALPVVAYSAGDYWRSAWTSLRRRLVTIDVPIAAGIAAIFLQSVFEVVTGRGGGYFDSLSGLIFFLLCGRWFQQKTYDRLSFERDYRSFFPLSVTRRRDGTEQRVSLSQLAVGDRLVLRNGELIPADARLVSGGGLLDYSFVTGESEPVAKAAGDYLYAGGRQTGSSIEVELVKAVSQSYLTTLWNAEAFQKPKDDSLDTLTNRYSKRFTLLILAVAVVALLVWVALGDVSRGVKAFASVLIVACPCALALAAPFTLGTALRVLGGREGFLKSAHVIERLARVDAVVLDKTGTLTRTGTSAVQWLGAPLGEDEATLIYSLCRHSTHPYAVRIGESLEVGRFPEPVRSFLETPGCGIEARAGGRELWIGSEAWLRSRGASPSTTMSESGGSAVHVAFDGRHRGTFLLSGALRNDAGRLFRDMPAHIPMALVSGDGERERERFRALMGKDAALHFHQSPLDKLEFIRRLQRGGKTVMMVGDGLNDAGALRQADVGVAMVEDMASFSPASDVILRADRVGELAAWRRFARRAVGVVRVSFGISAAYNIIGVAIAASGNLSPVICAVLMPLSSVTVVAFTTGATLWLGRRLDNSLRTEVRP